MSRVSFALALLVVLAACRGGSAPPDTGTGDPNVVTPAEVDPAAPAFDIGPPPEPGGEPGVPGSPAPEVSFRVGDGRCFVYPGWVVVVRPRTGAPGEDVIVAARPAGSEARTLCASPPARPAAAITDRSAPTSFFGLVEGLLLIDSGTGTQGRTLRAVDLSSGRTTLETTYEEPIAVEAGMLQFSEPIGGFTTMEPLVATGVNCPDAQAWLEDGFAVGVNRVVHFHLAERRRETTGDLVCVPLQ